jgi:hypothetical protein
VLSSCCALCKLVGLQNVIVVSCLFSFKDDRLSR